MSGTSEPRRHPLRQALRHAAIALSAGCFVSAFACVGGCRHEPGQNGSTGAPARLPKSASGGTGATRVGNGDPSGVQNQPNWEEMAGELRVRVNPRLPDSMPADAQVACTHMLDAARTFYTNTEPSPGRRQARLDELATTRDDDMQACVAHTSVRAAACVTVLLGDRDSEFPWLLDQCMRAYPRGV